MKGPCCALLACFVLASTGRSAPSEPVPEGATAATQIGSRLFSETRFSHVFSEQKAGGAGAPEIAVARRSPDLVSCAGCHSADLPETDRMQLRREGLLPGKPAARDPIPDRGDGRNTTPRNAPSLRGVLDAPEGTLFHFDGEFATVATLVEETFLGRNYGWLPDEHVAALRHFARVIRDEEDRNTSVGRHVPLSYAVLVQGTDPRIPATWRLPPSLRFDPAAATDEEVLHRGTELVVAFLRSLQFSSDAAGLFNGSAYDAFLAANRLPRAPRAGETEPEYARRLREQVAALRAPRWIDEPGPTAQEGRRSGGFGPLELDGMTIFFRSAVGAAQTAGAGNCAECHVPPRFTDFRFHNTGAAQDEFDAVHGDGAFIGLAVPADETRAADYNRWLPPTPRHPLASGNLLSPPDRAWPERADLGLWNVFGNPDFPAPQPALERLLNLNGRLARGEVLASALARFKTPTLRGLDESAPYLHSGQARSLREAVVFYQRMSDLARAGRLRNAPPEFFSMRLGPEDIEPLTAFLTALNERRDAAGP